MEAEKLVKKRYKKVQLFKYVSLNKLRNLLLYHLRKKITQKDKENLIVSFSKIIQSKNDYIYDIVYYTFKNVFYANPKIEELYTKNIQSEDVFKKHCTLVVYAINTIIQKLQNDECIIKDCTYIARKHEGKQITEELFMEFGVSFIAVASEKVADWDSKSYDLSWIKLFKFIYKIISEEENKLKAAQDRRHLSVMTMSATDEFSQRCRIEMDNSSAQKSSSYNEQTKSSESDNYDQYLKH